MNPIVQQLIDKFGFIVNNPSEAALIASFSLLIVGIVFNHLYKERIATLDERIKLRDDKIEYYKNINAELENKQKLSPVSVQPNASIPTPKISPQKSTSSPPRPNKIRLALLEAISHEVSNGFTSASMKVIQSIQPLYELGDILSELVRMQHEGVLTWDNAPSFPEHWMELKLSNL